ncbi:rCG54034 [Rattus norvegicus]|uniref:RCG54034 n=1 Tax=Rattus norvegicus TaxID=10116 RepID=A6JA18_RAT|nr:rCG54034 [Rattus norvegicus]
MSGMGLQSASSLQGIRCPPGREGVRNEYCGSVSSTVSFRVCVCGGGASPRILVL